MCPSAGGLPRPTTEYLLDENGEQLSVLDGAGNWLRTNAYAGGRLLATYNASGLHFALSDWLGTKRMQLSAAGAVEKECQSLPFGDDLDCSGTGSDATPLHFTGKERDQESGFGKKGWVP